MSSFMRRHFKWYGMICTFSGLPILHGPQTSDYDEGIDHFSWNKWYLIYSIACLTVWALVELIFFYQLWLAIFVRNLIFTTTVNALFHVVSAVKAALNASIPFIKARSLQRFFNESCEYEQRVHFVAPTNRRKPTLTFCLIRPLLLVAFAANVGICSYFSIELVGHLGYGPTLSLTLKITVVAGHFLFYVYDAACFLVLRPCCEVIPIIHRAPAQGSTVHRAKSRHSRRWPGKASTIGREGQAEPLHRITPQAKSKRRLGAGCSGLQRHAALHLLHRHLLELRGRVQDSREPDRPLVYTVLTSLDFLDITVLSDRMVEEVRNMRHTLQNVATSSENSDYVTQLAPSYGRHEHELRESSSSGCLAIRR
ncbi:hypothetical protein MTO96_034767 [Rhipicephalus appendiculatus]